MKMPQFLGIVNVTPDSFSDGGETMTVPQALQKCRELTAAGADILDIGGESTRPGACEVGIAEEIRRTVPLIRALKAESPELKISIDTRKPEVAFAALEAGACMVNDVSGLAFAPAVAEAAAAFGAWLVLGHARGTPDIMNRGENCCYSDLCGEIMDFWHRAADKAAAAGVSRERIIYDPCLGFSKTPEQDCRILQNIGRLQEAGPVMIGHSRKSFIGKVTGEPDSAGRGGGTAAVSVFAAMQGADYLRVHDVRASRQAIMMYQKLIQPGAE